MHAVLREKRRHQRIGNCLQGAVCERKNESAGPKINKGRPGRHPFGGSEGNES